MPPRDRLFSTPYAFDFFKVMRLIERGAPDMPRIGESAATREDVVRLGQNPYMEFPASNIEAVSENTGKLRVLVRFLGMLGPQGALPLALTQEAYSMMRRGADGDDAMPRFIDLFNHRFLQLFYRAWANARPHVQHERPKDDRFVAYAGMPLGLGLPSLQAVDSIPDRAKLRYAGLLGTKIKSLSRLENALIDYFGVPMEILPFQGLWLNLDAEDTTRLGQKHAQLGLGTLLGSSVYSVEDYVSLQVSAPNLSTYKRFLPSGDWIRPLKDMIFGYLGHEIGWDVRLALPATDVPQLTLGVNTQVGWTSWLPQRVAHAGSVRNDARFAP
jgi:type VI secretion system protein ImpH